MHVYIHIHIYIYIIYIYIYNIYLYTSDGFFIIHKICNALCMYIFYDSHFTHFVYFFAGMLFGRVQKKRRPEFCLHKMKFSSLSLIVLIFEFQLWHIFTKQDRNNLTPPVAFRINASSTGRVKPWFSLWLLILSSVTSFRKISLKFLNGFRIYEKLLW